MERDREYEESLEYDEEEYERRRREYIRRRRLQKRRQLRRRRLLRLVSMAAILVLIIVLAGRGIYKVLSGGGKKVPTEVSTQVKADTKTEEGHTQKEQMLAQKQPVMSASDIEKMSRDTTMFGWQEDEKGRWYRNTDGAFYENGWQEIEGAKYYFDDNGYVHTGWLELEGKDYWFNETGVYDSSKIRPKIALTYDDGPGKYTEELLNCLEENHAKATFFMLGANVEKYPEVVQRMKESGMELGNHTYNHKMLNTLNTDEIKQEIGKTDTALKKVSGSSADLLRPPGGAYNETVQKAAGHPIIKWSIDTKDWATRSADNTYKVVMENAQNGSIILMHDIHESSVQASLKFIPDLVAKGFKLVTVQELAEAQEIELEDGKAYYYMGEGTQQVE